MDESPLVRLHFIIGRNEGPLPKVDVRALEQQIAALLETWDDALAKALGATYGRNEGLARLAARSPRFSPGYRSLFSATEAARDLAMLEDLTVAKDGLNLHARVWRKDSDAGPALHLKLYVLGELLPLSASLPVFESLGLKVIAEDSFPVSFNVDGGWRRGSDDPGFRDGTRRRPGGPSGRYPRTAGSGLSCRAAGATPKATISTGW